jgi:hypothetical protein
LKAQFSRCSRIRFVVTGGLAALLAYAAFAAIPSKDPTPEVGVGSFFGSPPQENGVPIFNAKPVRNFTDARTLLALPLPRPESCAANDNSVRNIYVSPSQVQAFVEYEEIDPAAGCLGVEEGHVEVVVHWNLDDAAITAGDEYAKLEEEAAQFGGAAIVVTVEGVPVIAFQGGYGGNCDTSGADVNGCVPTQNNPSSVRLEPGGGLQVWVYGSPSWTTDQIMAVAGTVTLPPGLAS